MYRLSYDDMLVKKSPRIAPVVWDHQITVDIRHRLALESQQRGYSLTWGLSGSRFYSPKIRYWVWWSDHRVKILTHIIPRIITQECAAYV